MKKSLLIVLLVVFAGVSANAQLFIGGGIGINVNSTDNTSEFGFNLFPEVGYSLNDRFDIGIDVGFGINSQKQEVLTLITKTTTTNWSIAPYARYAVFQYKKFSILGKGSLMVFGNGTKTKTGDATPVRDSSTGFGIEILPMLTYDLTQKFTLYTELNFLTLGLSTSRGVTSFRLGADADNLVNVGDIRIGFFYKF